MPIMVPPQVAGGGRHLLRSGEAASCGASRPRRGRIAAGHSPASSGVRNAQRLPWVMSLAHGPVPPAELGCHAPPRRRRVVRKRPPFARSGRRFRWSAPVSSMTFTLALEKQADEHVRLRLEQFQRVPIGNAATAPRIAGRRGISPGTAARVGRSRRPSAPGTHFGVNAGFVPKVLAITEGDRMDVMRDAEDHSLLAPGGPDGSWRSGRSMRRGRARSGLKTHRPPRKV